MRRCSLVLCLLLSCGDSDARPIDANTPEGDVRAIDMGSPDEGNEPPLHPAAPAAPRASSVTECPDGWQLREFGGAATCLAYGDEIDLRCPLGSILPPGASRCEVLGDACPEDGMPESTTITHWVRAGAVGGDGTQRAPVATIGEALALSEPGDVIGVGVGSYDESLTIPPGITLLGACTSGVRLTNSTGAGPVVREGEVTFQNLAIVGAEGVGLRALESANVVVDGVAIAEARSAGLLVSDGARLRAQNLTVFSTRVSAEGTQGRGIQVQSGSTATLSRTQVGFNLEYGVVASESTLRVEDSVIHDTGVSPADDTEGQGMIVVDGAEVTLRRVAIRANHEAGIFAAGNGTSVDVFDADIDDTARNRQTRAAGIAAIREAEVHLERAVIRATVDYSVSCTDEARLLARDIVLVGPRRGTAHALIRGTTQATIEVERATLVDGTFWAITLTDQARATFTDLTVRPVEDLSVALPDGALVVAASALQLDFGAHASLERAHLSGLTGVAVFSSDDSSVRLVDVKVDGVGQAPDGVNAIASIRGGTLDLTRVRLRNVEGSGVYIEDGTINASDLILSTPTGTGPVGFAEGVGARNAVVMGTRWRIEGGFGFGARIWNAQTTLGSVTIENVGELSCPAEGCLVESIDGFGMGLGVYAESTLSVQRLAIDGAAFCGLHVDETSALSVASGTIANSAVGACLHGDRTQLDALSRTVLFRDNDLNVDTAILPIPDAPSL
ncbi:MAG: right-handed parallel beta-helix repeat-containing protein [Myxococcota bacterium]